MLKGGSETRYVLVAGVDEAGRGPLAGPVYAAAVILDKRHPIQGLRDSKLLAPEVREKLAVKIKARAVAWSVASADVAEIDAINILRATLAAMARAVEGLGVAPEEVLVDGNHCPSVAFPARAIIGGDNSVKAISAASILAKTARDAHLVALDLTYPGYGFARNKGYGTPEHLEALQRLGPCPVHRRSFAPVLQSEFDF